MTQINIEMLGPVNVYLGLGIEIVTAFILGGAIGIDRQKKLKPAGIKTNMLICLGATLYTAISLILQKEVGGVADPNRVAAQVVSGIGFLGAGAIMKGGLGIIGLTTAATIWVVAAVGVTIGCGFPIIAAMFTFTILIILKLLTPIYEFFEIPKKYYIEILSKGSIRDNLKGILFHEVGVIIDVIEEEFSAKDKMILNHCMVKLSSKQVSDLMKKLGEVIQVTKTNYREMDENGDDESHP